MADAALSRRCDVRIDNVRADRVTAVARAIESMRTGLALRQPLAELARTGLFSPSHFHRVFREITTVTPARFLAALRMAEARAFLLHSELTVAQIGVRVGYRSLTTFSTQFARLVGVTPGHFRRLARAVGDASVGAPVLRAAPGRPWAARRSVPRLALSGFADRDTVVIASVRPVGSVREHPDCWVLAASGSTVPLGPVPDGAALRVCAVVADRTTRLTDVLVDRLPGSYLTGAAHLPAGPGRPEPVTVDLHPPAPTDLPLLTAAPLRWLARRVGNLGPLPA
jgi:AraC family transcriptional regulator